MGQDEDRITMQEHDRKVDDGMSDLMIDEAGNQNSVKSRGSE